MYISKLCLRNFRNFAASCVRFHKGINTIIGENGSGKTNIMHAIRILLDECMPRSYRFFESDFNRSLSNWKGHWIIIQVYFEELDHGDEAQALALHSIGNPSEFERSKGSCAVFFRPKYEIRKKLYDLSEDAFKSSLDLQNIIDQITLNDYEICYTARSGAEFSDENVYKQHVGDFDAIEFPDPAKPDHLMYGNKLYISNFTAEVSCTFIKALRDVESDLKSYRDNPLINLLRGKEKTIQIGRKKELEHKVTELNKEISDLEEVKDIADGVALTIKSSVGETYAPNLSIRSELPDNMEKLMQSLKLWVGDSIDEEYLGKIWELSLGGANLVYLSTKLLEYQKVKSKDKIANFLLIEEPEAHIHTHIQKTLFEKIPEGKTQVIISTHSTHISSVCRIKSVNIISKYRNKVEVYEPSNKLTSSEIAHIERYLDAVRSNLLFARSIILVEGDAEAILIPVMVKRVLGISLDEVGISLVNVGSTGFQNIATLFHKERIKKCCSIITDLDESILPLPTDKKKDTRLQRACRNSAYSGKQRKEKLEEFISENDYLKTFYARNTFEVQFIQAGNKEEVFSVVDKQYTHEDAIIEIKRKLSDSDVSVFGSEVLRLANKYGKGWFALLLAEEISSSTIIPEYILNGLAFATSHIGIKIKKSLATRRLDLLIRDQDFLDFTEYKAIKESVWQCSTDDALRECLIEHLPTDPITRTIAFQ